MASKEVAGCAQEVSVARALGATDDSRLMIMGGGLYPNLSRGLLCVCVCVLRCVCVCVCVEMCVCVCA